MQIKLLHHEKSFPMLHLLKEWTRCDREPCSLSKEKFLSYILYHSTIDPLSLSHTPLTQAYFHQGATKISSHEPIQNAIIKNLFEYICTVDTLCQGNLYVWT